MIARLVSGLFLCAVLMSAASMAQFKSQVENDGHVGDRLYGQPEPSLLLGWFNPEKFHMNHSIDLSYTSFGGQGVSLSTYTNSMLYEFADNLNARADVSVQFSPFNNLPSVGGKKLDLSSIYLSRAEINYKPWENTLLRVQFRQLPYGMYSPYSAYGSPWYREDGF